MDLEDAVLLAIAEGLNDPKRIAKKLNVRLEDVKSAIDSLESKGLIVRKSKGLIFKKDVYELTRSGFERAERIREKLRKVANEFKIAYESGDKAKLERLYHDYYYLIPFMVMFGLIDLIWLSTLLDLVDDVAVGGIDDYAVDDSGFEDFDVDIEF